MVGSWPMKRRALKHQKEVVHLVADNVVHLLLLHLMYGSFDLSLLCFHLHSLDHWYCHLHYHLPLRQCRHHRDCLHL